MTINKLSPLPLKEAVYAIEALAGSFDPQLQNDVIELRKRMADITADELN